MTLQCIWTLQRYSTKFTDPQSLDVLLQFSLGLLSHKPPQKARLMSQRNFFAQKKLESSSFVSQGGALTAAYFSFLFLLNRL